MRVVVTGAVFALVAVASGGCTSGGESKPAPSGSPATGLVNPDSASIARLRRGLQIYGDTSPGEPKTMRGVEVDKMTMRAAGTNSPYFPAQFGIGEHEERLRGGITLKFPDVNNETQADANTALVAAEVVMRYDTKSKWKFKALQLVQPNGKPYPTIFKDQSFALKPTIDQVGTTSVVTAMTVPMALDSVNIVHAQGTPVNVTLTMTDANGKDHAANICGATIGMDGAIVGFESKLTSPSSTATLQ